MEYKLVLFLLHFAHLSIDLIGSALNKPDNKRSYTANYVFLPPLVYRESYMSAHVLLNLLNELGKKIRCEALTSISSVFPNEFNKFNNT